MVQRRVERKGALPSEGAKDGVECKSRVAVQKSQSCAQQGAQESQSKANRTLHD